MTKDELQSLVDKGKAKGFLSFAEINGAISVPNHDYPISEVAEVHNFFTISDMILIFLNEKTDLYGIQPLDGMSIWVLYGLKSALIFNNAVAAPIFL